METREKLIEKVMRRARRVGLADEYPDSVGAGIGAGMRAPLLAKLAPPRKTKAKARGGSDEALDSYEAWLRRGTASASSKKPLLLELESDEESDSDEDIADAVGGSDASKIIAALIVKKQLDLSKMKGHDMSEDVMARAVLQKRKEDKKKEKKRQAEKERMFARISARKKDKAEAEAEAEGGAATRLHTVTKDISQKEGKDYKDVLKMLLGLSQDERVKHGLPRQRAKAGPNDKRRARGKLVAEAMKKHGVDLARASQIVKEEADAAASK